MQPPVCGTPSPPSRLQALDTLRGLAISGLVYDHLADYAAGGGPPGAALQQAREWLVERKVFAMFAILLGAGFAIQLRNADARAGLPWRFLRRLLGLWGLALALVALTGRGGNLTHLAGAGVWILVVRRWPSRAVIAVLIASIAGARLWPEGGGGGPLRAAADGPSPATVSPADRMLHEARQAPTYADAVSARGRALAWKLASLLDDGPRRLAVQVKRSLLGPLPFVLAGLLAVRLGVFERPREWTRLLSGTMLAGAALWTSAHWPFGTLPAPPEGAPPVGPRPGLLFDGDWGWYLSLTYVSAILLLVGHSAPAGRALAAAFGAAGRLALSIYVLHFVLLDAVFERYGWGLASVTPLGALAGAAVAIAVFAWAGRWWLARFRSGPVEWLLRQATFTASPATGSGKVQRGRLEGVVS